MRRGIGERDRPRARHGEHRELGIAERIGQRRKQLHLARLRPRRDVAIAQTAARAVVAHDAKAFGQAGEEMAEARMLPIALHVTYPPCRAEDERPLADYRVGDAGTVSVPNESNGLRWGH